MSLQEPIPLSPGKQTTPTSFAPAPNEEHPFVPVWLVVLAVVLQIADLVSAAWMVHERGALAEVNPIARMAYLRGGVPGLVVLKGLVAVAVALGLRDARREWRPGYGRLVLGAAATAGGFGCWSNLP